MPQEENHPTKHARANHEYLKGNYAEAIRWQAEVVNDQIRNGEEGFKARKLLALYLYSSGELDAAVTLLKILSEESRDDSEIPENIGVILRQAGRIEESVEYLLCAHKMSPGNFNICDGLAQNFHSLEQTEQVQEFGRRSLILKDQFVREAKSWPVPEGAPPLFEGKNRNRNVLSFSLVGEDQRDLQGALRNAGLAEDLYPGWTCRFYCDPRVPRSVIEKLKRLQCEIVMRPEPGNSDAALLWRLGVVDDPSIDRFLVRDCGSIINIRERVAVDEWLASDKWFHIMRDFPSQTELILGGMWGGVSGVLPSIRKIEESFSPRVAPSHTFEQQLLRTMIWPTVRKSVLVHDSVYTGCLSSVPFPEVGTLPPNRHVGQKETSQMDRKEPVGGTSNRGADVMRFFIFGMNHSGISVLQNLLNFHSEVFCPARHHLSSLWKNSDRSAKTYRKVFEEINKDRIEFQIDSESIRKELFNTWMEHFFVNYTDESIRHVGITDHSLDAKFAYHAANSADVKFIYVTRDPRDLLVARYNHKKVTEPGFARDKVQIDELTKTVATQWAQKLKNVQAFDREEPGRIELVRFEDLVSGEKQVATLNRILNFLEVPVTDEMVKTFFEKQELAELKASAFQAGTGYEHKSTVRSWEDSLSIAQIDQIQKRSARLMELLHYKILPIDRRNMASGDTILPS